MQNFDKNETINERIAQVIRHYNHSALSFSKEIDVSSSVMGNIVGGRFSKPSIEVIQKLISTYEEISIEWLIMGWGQMLKGTQSSNQTNEPTAKYVTNGVDNNQQIKFLNDHIRELTEVIKNLSAK